MIFVIAGWRWRAAGLGFLEVLIWALAVGGLVQSITQPVVLLACAGGFATGNLVGMAIEQKLALGIRVVRIINREPQVDLPAILREHGCRVTSVAGEGKDGPVELAFAVVKRRALANLLALIEQTAPKAILTVERAEHASADAFSSAINPRRSMWLGVAGVRK